MGADLHVRVEHSNRGTKSLAPDPDSHDGAPGFLAAVAQFLPLVCEAAAPDLLERFQHPGAEASAEEGN